MYRNQIYVQSTTCVVYVCIQINHIIILGNRDFFYSLNPQTSYVLYIGKITIIHFLHRKQKLCGFALWLEKERMKIVMKFIRSSIYCALLDCFLMWLPPSGRSSHICAISKEGSLLLRIFR